MINIDNINNHNSDLLKNNKFPLENSFTYGEHTFQDKLNCKEKYYFKTIDNYFKNKNITQMFDIINGTSKISLRMLDYFVTKFAKKEKTRYFINSNNEKERFNVYIEYKAQLKSYKKKNFDPFNRKTKLIYVHKNTKLYTSLCQLNFFKWAYSYGIIKYINKHFDQIALEMKKNSKETRIKNINKIKNKQNSPDLNNSVSKSVPIDNHKPLNINANSYSTSDKFVIVVSFDD